MFVTFRLYTLSQDIEGRFNIIHYLKIKREKQSQLIKFNHEFRYSLTNTITVTLN